MKSQDRLCITLVGPLPPPSGGMANQTRQLARLLEQDGLAVDLVQVNAPYRPKWITYLHGIRALFRLVPYLVRLWRAAGRADVMHVMANSGWAWHLFAAPAILIAALRGVPVVVNYRGGNAESFLQRQAWMVLPVLRKAKVLAVPSAFLADRFRQYGLSAAIVPNIVDLERFKTTSGAMARPAVSSSLHLIVTRNLEAIYDIPTALRAFQRIREQRPDARLTIAGSGPERENLAAEAMRLGLADHVEFSGRLELQAMAQLYAKAHIMLNPSQVDNMPNSILEAWASGVVVVSTAVGGIPAMVHAGEDAILVPAGDAEAMAAAVLNVSESPEPMRRLASAGRNSAERCSWPRIKPLWMSIYQNLADTRYKMGNRKTASR